MTIREMQIDINQSTQLVAANRTRKWYPEEIDWVLNKIQDQFIRSKLRPRKDQSGMVTGGFELDQVNTDDIRMLITTNNTLKPYIVDAERYKCFLPADYGYLISDGSRTTNLCGATPSVIAQTLYITSLRQERSDKGSAPFYEDNVVVMPDQTVNIPDDLPYTNTYAGYPQLEDITFLIPWVLWKSGWYWEKFGNEVYNPSYYVQVQSSAPTVPGVTVDGDPFVEYTTVTRALTYHAGTGKLVNNRLSSTDTIRNLRQAAFYRTAEYSPITELEGNVLWIYRDSSFIVNNVEVSYIRKPRPMSLSLNSDCELAETAHRTICDLATEYLQGRVKDLQGMQISEANMIKRLTL